MFDRVHLYDENNIKTLNELREGETALIIKVHGKSDFRKRILEMGFVAGTEIKVIKKAPLHDPIEYELMGYHVSLRRREAKLIEVTSPDNVKQEEINFSEIVEIQSSHNSNLNKNEIKIALVGNPNSGKTSIFNFITGRKEKVGNYGGVTVDIKTAKIDWNTYNLEITDLPGTYSLSDYSAEETYVREFIFNNKPDVIVNIVDATNIERNLYLTTQLIEMNQPVVVALNMFDELEKNNIKFNYQHLSEMIGIPIVPTIGNRGKGLDELFQTVVEVFRGKNPFSRNINIIFNNDIEESISVIENYLKTSKINKTLYPNRFLAIKLLEDNTKVISQVISSVPDELITIINRERNKITKHYGEDIETLFANHRYGFIRGALHETIEKTNKIITNPYWIDNILTHKFWGFPIFLFFMWLTFQTTFSLGSYPMEAIDQGVSLLSNFLSNLLQEGAFRDLLVDGIVGGVGAVIVFLPNILILFFFISFMEDTGYMARAAFLMDRLMHKIGLHGKSFIPLLMGFGCNVPAVMATRTLESRKDRILTMLIIPFMSCSARLPVYVLFISAFFVAYQGLVLLSIYIIGIMLAVVVAIIFKNLLFKGQDQPFVMELPPYRIPTIRNVSIHMWDKAVQYLKKMGTFILVASIIIWALGYFPRNVNYSVDYDKQINLIEKDAKLSIDEKSKIIQNIQLDKDTERMEKSFIGQLGHFIQPAIEPMGWDWKIGVSIITGLAAKEIIVSTMGVLYHSNIEDDNTFNLQKKLREQTHSVGKHKGELVFNPLVAYSLMLFILIYFPCVAVIAAINREANWKWAVFTMAYTTGLAYFVSLIVYQIGKLFI